MTAKQRAALALAVAPAPLALAVVVFGGPLSITVLMLMLMGVAGPFVEMFFRRPLGVLRFRVLPRALEFRESTVARDAFRRTSPLLLLGPIEAVRLIAVGGSTGLPTITSYALWFGLPGFFGLRRELRTWPGAARVEVARDGVTATVKSSAVRDPWSVVPAWVGGPHPLQPVLSVGPSLAGPKPFPEGLLASDPDLVARVIEFYRTNVGARVELGTPAGIARLRRGDFATKG